MKEWLIFGLWPGLDVETCNALKYKVWDLIATREVWETQASQNDQLRTTVLSIRLWALNKEWRGQHLQFLRCLFGAFPNVKFWLPSTFHPFNQSALDDGRTWALPQERWKYRNSWERIFFIVKAWNWTCQLNKSSPTFNSNDSLHPVQNCVKPLRISTKWRKYRLISVLFSSFLCLLQVSQPNWLRKINAKN